MKANLFIGKSSIFVILVLFILSSVSCVKRLEEDSSAAVSKKQMWKTYDDAKAGLVAIYGLTRSALADGNAHWMYGELRLGDFQSTRSGNYLDAVIKNELNKGFPEIIALSNWRKFYAAIDACNTFIENSRNCRADLRYSELNNIVDVAQAHILRSFLYFYMVRIWGDVPLITTASKEGVNVQIARTPQNTVLNFCANEIITYRDSLPTEYGKDDKSKLNYDGLYYGESWETWGNSFWGYYQAVGLLAQIYAWMGNYDGVIEEAKKIESERTWVHTDYIRAAQVKTYLAGSTSIFYSNGVKGDNCYQIMSFPYNMANRESGPSGVGHIESMTLANPFVVRNTPDIFIPRDSIISMFYSAYDYRHPFQSQYQNYDAVYFTNYYGAIPIFAKFKTIAPGANTFSIFGSCIPLYRWEDNQLLLAEAYAAKQMESSSYPYINELRKYRNTPGYRFNVVSDGTGITLPPTPESNHGGLTYNVFRERRIELAGEGTRWYDQIRYQKLVRNDPKLSKLIDEGGIYWPIDQEIINKNPLIEQNSYWKK